MELNDYTVKYAGVFRKRKNADEKIRFLSALKDDFEAAGFEGNLYKKDFKKRSSISLYAGDIKRAKTIVVTHYDAPLWTFGRKTLIPMNDRLLRRHIFITQTLIASILVGIGVLFYTLVAAPVLNSGTYGFWNFASYGVLILLVYLMMQIPKGIEDNAQVVSNTASVLSALYLAHALQKANRNDVAFVFVDSGSQDRLGHLTFRDYYSENHLASKVVILDMVGVNEIHIDDTSFDTPMLKNIASDVTLVAGGTHVHGVLQQRRDQEMTQTSIDNTVSTLIKLV